MSRCFRNSEVSVPQYAAVLLVIFCVASAMHFGASRLEASMAMHMLVQIPLLIILGAACFDPTANYNRLLKKFDSLGVIAFISFTAWMWFWMLPVNLDLATIAPSVRLLKLISIPIGIGFCLRWLWSQANGAFKGLIIFETWASITRLGWLYVESPLQLCSSYLIGEQQQVGTLLMQTSAASAIIAISYSLFGSFNQNNVGEPSNSSK